MLTPEQIQTLQQLHHFLQSNHIRYQIVGGLAAIIYGAKNRPLYDIDIDVPKEHQPKLEELFKDYITHPLHHYIDDQYDLMLMTLKINEVPNRY